MESESLGVEIQWFAGDGMNMKSSLIVCFFLVIITGCSCRQLPPSFKKCDIKRSDFTECLTKAIPGFIRQLKTPMKEMGLPSLKPLVIPALWIESGTEPSVFRQNYTDMKVSGFTNISCSKVEIDFERMTMIMSCSSLRLIIETNYIFNGSVNGFPLYGDGNGTMILDKVKCFHVFNLKEYQKRGRKHLKVYNSTLDVNPTLITYKFDNLFDGDKILNENINLVLNDNWREVYNVVKDGYEQGFSLVFASLFNSLLSRVSLPELFTNG